MPLTMPSIAWSSGASSKTTFAALPPSSSVSFLRVPASSRWIALPTSVEPVNAILSIPGCLTISAPVRPSPVTMFTTPGGSSAWRRTSQNARALSGVDREADVLGAGLGDLGERLLGRGIDGRERLAGAGLEPLAADVEPVALAERDDVARLGRRRVRPVRRDGGGAALGLELGHAGNATPGVFGVSRAPCRRRGGRQASSRGTRTPTAA